MFCSSMCSTTTLCGLEPMANSSWRVEHGIRQLLHASYSITIVFCSPMFFFMYVPLLLLSTAEVQVAFGDQSSWTGKTPCFLLLLGLSFAEIFLKMATKTTLLQMPENAIFGSVWFLCIQSFHVKNGLLRNDGFFWSLGAYW